MIVFLEKSDKKYSLTNARSDTLLQKKSYKVPLLNGQRCVIVADGYYEWKANTNGKQPYYFTFFKNGESCL